MSVQIEFKYLELEVIDCDTILTRIIQVVKKRNLQIQSFVAEEPCHTSNRGVIKLWVKTNEDKIEPLKRQLEKIIEVTKVTSPQMDMLADFKHHDFVPAY